MKLSHAVPCALIFCCLSIGLAPALWCQAATPETGLSFEPLLINETQGGGVTALASDNNADLLASAGGDGTIKLFRDKGHRLVQHLQIGLYPIIGLAIGPGDRLAALEKQSGGRFLLSVWNWRTGSQLYSVPLQDQVIFMAFSAPGNYLVCTLARWNSLLCLGLSKGRFQNWLADGFGLVDFALMSAREDRIMSYQATTGTLIYHDLASGMELKKLETKSRLQGFQLVPDGTKTRAVALENGVPVCIDLVAGSVLDSKSPGFAVTRLLVNEADPQHLIALGGVPGNFRIAHYGIDPNGQLILGNQDKSGWMGTTETTCLVDGQPCMGNSDGRLAVLGPNDSKTILNSRLTTAISSVAFSSQGLYLGSSAGTFKLATDLFGLPDGAPALMGRFEQTSVSGIPPLSGLLTINDRELLFWDNGRSPRLNRWDTRKDSLIKSTQPASGNIVNLNIRKDQISSVDSSGTVRVYSLADLKQVAQFPAQGAFCSALTGDGKLIVGQGASGSKSSSLQSITLKTGENLPLEGGRSALFNLVFAPMNKTLFAIALSLGKDLPVTSLEQGSARGLETAVMSIPGEDFGADLVLAPDESRVYTSLGGIGVVSWDGQGLGRLGTAPHAPRRLAIFRNWLASVNSDGSVTLFNLTSKEPVLDLRLSTNGTLFCLTRDKTFCLATRTAGNKTLPADPKEQQNILSALYFPQAMQTDGLSAPQVAKLPVSLD